MFTFLGLRNFRAFEKVEIDFAPITIIVGPNNAGKSSILSGLRILSQTARSEDPRAPLLLKGPFGDFGTYKDLVYQNQRRRTIGLTVGVSYRRKDASREARLEITFAYRAQRREVVLQDSTLYDGAGRKIIATKYSPSSEKQTAEMFPADGRSVGLAVAPRLLRPIHFLVPYWNLEYIGRMPAQRERPPSSIMRDAAFAREAFHAFIRAFAEVEYLGPFRVSPDRTPQFSGERPVSVGMDGARALHVLATDCLQRGRKNRRLLNQIVPWLKAAEIAGDVMVRALSDRHFEMLVQHFRTGEFENLADVGYGTSQVLPVLAGGFNLSQGWTFLVEQPELHLHPRAQAELGDFFAALYENRVQCILETHSEHLIVRLQKHVATGRINPEHLAIYFVHSPGLKKEVVRRRVARNGLFVDKWPRGFFEDRLEEVTQLAQASSKAE
jgi:predicted ATPase